MRIKKDSCFYVECLHDADSPEFKKLGSAVWVVYGDTHTKQSEAIKTYLKKGHVLVCKKINVISRRNYHIVRSFYLFAPSVDGVEFAIADIYVGKLLKSLPTNYCAVDVDFELIKKKISNTYNIV